MAVVVVRPGDVVSQETVIEHCRKNLAKYKVPREVVFSETPLPRHAAGKLLKRELKKQYART
ncbi:MAG: hypothetical protein HXY41_08995 [Chloroflexi bacterium]|nr:hypothetical protein [Chloroflexota bacterium]